MSVRKGRQEEPGVQNNWQSCGSSELAWRPLRAVMLTAHKLSL